MHRGIDQILGSLALMLLIGITTGCGGATSTDGGASGSFDRKAYAEESLRFRMQESECLTELGFPASIQPEDRGMIPMKIEHNGRLEEMREAREVCAERLGGRPSAPPPDEAELSRFYDLEVEAYKCLLANGYDPEPPPSRATYVAAYWASPDGPWTAHRGDEGFLPDTECPVAQPENINW